MSSAFCARGRPSPRHNTFTSYPVVDLSPTRPHASSLLSSSTDASCRPTAREEKLRRLRRRPPSLPRSRSLRVLARRASRFSFVLFCLYRRLCIDIPVVSTQAYCASRSSILASITVAGGSATICPTGCRYRYKYDPADTTNEGWSVHAGSVLYTCKRSDTGLRFCPTAFVGLELDRQSALIGACPSGGEQVLSDSSCAHSGKRPLPIHVWDVPISADPI